MKNMMTLKDLLDKYFLAIQTEKTRLYYNPMDKKKYTVLALRDNDWYGYYAGNSESRAVQAFIKAEEE